MEIKLDKKDSALTIKLTERLDTVTSPDLEAVLQKELDGITDLTFDFDELDYISSAGLRVLLSTQKKMLKQGEMRIINASPVIMEIFEVTGFSDAIDIKAK
jgi:anti-sigma B factor antagonist